MKSTGMVRKVDILGRVVIPKELRQNLEIGNLDSLEIFKGDESIILRKYTPNCIFCGSHKDLTSFIDKKVCRKCIKAL